MLWLVTFVTHSSRISERMIRYHIQPGEPTILQPDDQVLVASAVTHVARTQSIQVLAFNVLPDHVHMIIEADSERRLAEHVRRLKGYSAHAYRRRHHAVGSTHLWAEKFNRRPIRDADTLRYMLRYVSHNHLKHADRRGPSLVTTWDERICPIVESACGRNLEGISTIL